MEMEMEMKNKERKNQLNEITKKNETATDSGTVWLWERKRPK